MHIPNPKMTVKRTKSNREITFVLKLPWEYGKDLLYFDKDVENSFSVTRDKEKVFLYSLEKRKTSKINFLFQISKCNWFCSRCHYCQQFVLILSLFLWSCRVNLAAFDE